jgi:hypothetical protein
MGEAPGIVFRAPFWSFHPESGRRGGRGRYARPVDVALEYRATRHGAEAALARAMNRVPSLTSRSITSFARWSATSKFVLDPPVQHWWFASGTVVRRNPRTRSSTPDHVPARRLRRDRRVRGGRPRNGCRCLRRAMHARGRRPVLGGNR